MITRTDMIAWGFGEGARHEGKKMWQWKFGTLKVALFDEGYIKINKGNCCAFIVEYEYSAAHFKAMLFGQKLEKESEMVVIIS